MEKGVPIRSIARAIAVLQSINQRGSLSLMEISVLSKLPYATAFRIVQTLVHQGLVTLEPSRKRYRVTSLVQTLSLGYRDHGRLVDLTRPYMVELTRKFGWPASLSTAVGSSMMLRDSTYAISSLSFSNYYPGYTFPVPEVASGHAHLAFMDDEARASVLNGLRQLGAQSLVLDMFESGKLTRRIRENGYAQHDRSMQTANPGKTSSIAVPIFEAGQETAELTISYFATAMSPAEALERYVGDLKSAADAIGTGLTRLLDSGAQAHIETGSA